MKEQPRKYKVSVTIIDIDGQYTVDTDDLVRLIKDTLNDNFEENEFKDIKVEEVD